MTHTLHRRGSEEELSREFVVLAMAARGVNREESTPRLAKILEIFTRHNPVNYGNVAGNSLNSSLRAMMEKTRDNTVSHAVFRSEEDLAAALRELRDADLGISIVVSGLLDRVRECCGKAGLAPHTVNISLGVFGKKELLPCEEVLEVATMCGHGMISFALIEEQARNIRAGFATPEEAARKLAAGCCCGVFNPERAAGILSRLAAA